MEKIPGESTCDGKIHVVRSYIRISRKRSSPTLHVRSIEELVAKFDPK
jgi:hypothetical protein